MPPPHPPNPDGLRDRVQPLGPFLHQPASRSKHTTMFLFIMKKFEARIPEG